MLLNVFKTAYTFFKNVQFYSEYCMFLNSKLEITYFFFNFPLLCYRFDKFVFYVK